MYVITVFLDALEVEICVELRTIRRDSQAFDECVKPSCTTWSRHYLRVFAWTEEHRQHLLAQVKMQAARRRFGEEGARGSSPSNSKKHEGPQWTPSRWRTSSSSMWMTSSASVERKF